MRDGRMGAENFVDLTEIRRELDLFERLEGVRSAIAKNAIKDIAHIDARTRNTTFVKFGIALPELVGIEKDHGREIRRRARIVVLLNVLEYLAQGATASPWA